MKDSDLRSVVYCRCPEMKCTSSYLRSIISQSVCIVADLRSVNPKTECTSADLRSAVSLKVHIKPDLRSVSPKMAQ